MCTYDETVSSKENTLCVCAEYTRGQCININSSVSPRYPVEDAGKVCWSPTIDRLYFRHAHFIPLVGVGKRGEY